MLAGRALHALPQARLRARLPRRRGRSPAGRIQVPRDHRLFERRFGRRSSSTASARTAPRRISASIRCSSRRRSSSRCSRWSAATSARSSGAVISVGTIHGGVKSNIIPEHVELAADRPRRQRPRCARNCSTASTGSRGERRWRSACPRTGCRSSPARPPRRRRRRSTTAPTAARVRGAIAAAMGADAADRAPPRRHGRRGFRLLRHARKRRARRLFQRRRHAARRSSRRVAGHHSPLFRILPEPSVTAGVEAMVVAAVALMPKR